VLVGFCAGGTLHTLSLGPLLLLLLATGCCWRLHCISMLCSIIQVAGGLGRGTILICVIDVDGVGGSKSPWAHLGGESGGSKLWWG
jgi:hypothetical protein